MIKFYKLHVSNFIEIDLNSVKWNIKEFNLIVYVVLKRDVTFYFC